MLTLPDFREKKIVFIESKNIKDICYKNDNLTVKEDDKIIQQNSFYTIFVIFVVGECTLTTHFLKKINQHGIMLYLLNFNLYPYLPIGGETEGNTLLRKKQYHSKNHLLQSKWLLSLKIKNQLSLLQKNRKKTQQQKEAIQNIKGLLLKIPRCQNLDSLLGIEGNVAKSFFKNYFQNCNWKGRKPRTKFDINNVLLDIGYTYLANFIECHLRIYGFDIYYGFCHQLFYQRKSLVCDLVEPFRCIIDETLFKMYSYRQLDEKDFEKKEHCYQIKRGFSKKYSKFFLETIFNRREEIFTFIQKYYRTIIQDKENFSDFKI